MMLEHILVVVLSALGVAYVVTGSTIGYVVRFLGFLVLPGPMKNLVFCPACLAWWAGFTVSLLLGWFYNGDEWESCEWILHLMAAFASSGLVALAQTQWGFAAEDREEIRTALERHKR